MRSRHAIVPIGRYSPAGSEPRDDAVAVEEPLEIRVEGQSVAVVMRTPGHDSELAAGFLLTEGVIRHRADLYEIKECRSEASQGNVAKVSLYEPEKFDPERLSRHVVTSSGCGICARSSVEAIASLFPPVEDDGLTFNSRAILAMPGQLAAAQETFRRTGGLHGCALFQIDEEGNGQLLAAREDVGRHNAVDKLLGRALLDDRLPLSRCLLFLSGRVSFELVHKALAGGIPAIAAISAPSSLAVEFAAANGQTLIGFVRGETMNVYAGAHRLTESSPPHRTTAPPPAPSG